MARLMILATIVGDGEVGEWLCRWYEVGYAVFGGLSADLMAERYV
jgi:hypothetical protein